MYEKTIPFKDYKGQPRNKVVQFNLEVREFLKLLPEFYLIANWQEQAQGDYKELTTEETVDFYNAFEAVLLTAWGEMSEDGLHFRKGGRYDFEESKLFAECMEIYVTQPAETNKLISGIMPEGMEKLVKDAQGNLDELAKNPDTPDNIQAEIARLQALQSSSQGSSTSVEQA